MILVFQASDSVKFSYIKDLVLSGLSQIFWSFSRLLRSGWMGIITRAIDPVPITYSWVHMDTQAVSWILHKQPGGPWTFRWVVLCWLVGGRLEASLLNNMGWDYIFEHLSYVSSIDFLQVHYIHYLLSLKFYHSVR